MTTIDKLNVFKSGQKAVAADINKNFNDIITAYNDTDNNLANLSKQAIKKDGSVTMAGNLDLGGYALKNYTGINAAGVRQAVLSCAVDSYGNPNYLTFSGLTGTLNANPSTPFIATIANGFNSYGSPDDISVLLTSNQSFALGANATYILLKGQASSDFDTTSSVISSTHFPLSPLSCQYVFRTDLQKMYQYMASAWVQTNRLPIATITTGSSSVLNVQYMSVCNQNSNTNNSLFTNCEYSVNSGVTDSNGYANFISKIDNSTVKILCSSTPLILTYPGGSQEIIYNDITVSNIANGSTTILVKEKGNATVQQCTGLITESSIPPSSPNNGDYWLNIGVKPYQAYKRVSGGWVAIQFVKLGEVNVSSGSMGTPISYAFNGKYSSGRFTIGAGSSYLLSHNIGTDKVKVKAYGAPSVGGPLAEFVTFYTTGPLWYGAAINHITKNIYSLQTYNPVTISEYAANNALDTAVEAIIFMERNF